MVSVDFFTVPTIRFQILYVFRVLAHDGGAYCILPSPPIPPQNGPCSSCAKLFPGRPAPRYLLRDRDQIFGKDFVNQVKAIGIKQVLSTPRSPWRRAYVERLIGTIRRDCLDHMIVFHAQSLRRHLHVFVDYYHRSGTHLGLQKDTPEAHPIQEAAAVPDHRDPRGRWTPSSLRAPRSLKSRLS